MPKLRNIALVVLGLTSLIFSRVLFVFFNDPEGPNLLIVLVAAVIVFAASLAPYVFARAANAPKKFLIALVIQLALLLVLYFLGTNF